MLVRFSADDLKSYYLEALNSDGNTLSGMHKIIEIFVGHVALHTEILALRQQVAVLKVDQFGSPVAFSRISIKPLRIPSNA